MKPKHSSTPWFADKGLDSFGRYSVQQGEHEAGLGEVCVAYSVTNRDFIIRAVNSFEAMRAALEELTELWEASQPHLARLMWPRGREALAAAKAALKLAGEE